MQPEILDVLYRLVGEHGWNWGMARNLINSQYLRRPRPKPDTVFK